MVGLQASMRRLVPTRFADLAACVVVCLCLVGCGKPPMIEVRGTVMLDGEPLSGCKVGLFPDVAQFDPDRHGFGFGLTDENGGFVIQHPQGVSGIWPGDYKVTLEAWVDKKGNPIPPEAKPSEVEGGVQNRLPIDYEASDTTPEKVTVKKGEPNVFEFNVSSAG